MYEYEVTPIEVPSGSGRKGVQAFDTELASYMKRMAEGGWRLVAAVPEIYVGRTTWLRLFWERLRP